MDLAGVILGLVLAIIWAEASAWLPALTRRIIRLAAKRLEPDLRERMEEEWLRYVQDSLYPYPWTLTISDQVDLQDPKVTEELGCMILGSEIVPSYSLLTDPPPPPPRGGPPYEFRNAPMPIDLQLKIWQKVDSRDHLLVRGLAAWLKARMLMQHQMFTLEALYSLYVALDATFSLICRKLKEQGIEKPDAWDAHAFLEEAEGRPNEGFPYFGDFYVDRVSTMHPESRYGVFPYAPVSNCDAHTLFENLREVFRLIILGEVIDPKNYVDV